MFLFGSVLFEITIVSDLVPTSGVCSMSGPVICSDSFGFDDGLLLFQDEDNSWGHFICI